MTRLRECKYTIFRAITTTQKLVFGGRSVPFQTYISEILQMNGVLVPLSAGLSVNTNPSASEKLLEKYNIGETRFSLLNKVV